VASVLGRRFTASRAALAPWLAIASEPALIIGLVVAGLAAHGINMFQYPALNRFDDEGVYLSQAWAVIREHQLAPYAYFYDHAPAGWLLLAGWMLLTGGPHAFGLAADSGRTFMLLLHLAMVVLLYRLARKLGCPVWAAALATLLFSVSPLAVYYQRAVLLDSFMLFWALLSLDLLLDDWGRLSRVALSGCCFGLALLSKESAAFLLPAMIFFAIQQRQHHHGHFAVVGWLLPMLMVASLYPMFALLRGELLPAGQSLRFFIFNIDTGPGLSLVDSVRWQATRGGGGLLNLNNQFWTLLRTDWLVKDPVIFIGGAVASVVNLLRGIRSRTALGAGLLGVLPLLYLARGGVVFDFYVLFTIPFFCLNLMLLLVAVARHTPVARTTPAAIMSTSIFGLLLVGYVRAGSLQPLYTLHSGEANREAVAWIKQHLPAQSYVVAGSDVWADLHEPGSDGPAFPNVHSHWKVGADPAIRDGVFHDDWRTVDYLILSPQVKQDIGNAGIAVAQAAMQHAHVVTSWDVDGSQIELWKVDKPGSTEASLLAGSASYMDHHFGASGGYVSANGSVTSESQGYAMLRAVWLGNRPAFDQAWGWTSAHLLGPDGLPAWLWKDGAVADRHSAMDADTDTALALLMAGKRWDDPLLIAAGRHMASAIWTNEVATVAANPYPTGGNWAPADAVVGINPSYFAPYAYRVFAQADPNHAWMKLVDSGYRVLFDASSANLGYSRSAGLPPNWVGLDKASGKLVPFNGGKDDVNSYGYDAARTYWRIAVDLRWSNDGRARTFLQQAGFLRDEVQRTGAPSAIYQHDGLPRLRSPSVVGDTGAVAALLTLDPNLANSLYAQQLVGGAAGGNSAHWADANDLYAQEWAWFGVALYGDAVPNLWNTKP
jgi:endo-1,4-beta-D-glucanase Y/4-amino-4-deoxy-L-arabinose transferase-like glycosyltransferase